MGEFGNPLLDLWRAALAHQRRHLTGADIERLRDRCTGELRPLFQCPACVAALRTGAPLADVANARHVAMSRYGCGILDEAAIATVRAWCGVDGIVEAGAGTGYNARLLREAGLDVVATDVLLPGEAPEDSAWQATAQPPYVPLVRLDAEAAVRRYPERTLLLIWPAYGDSFAARALAAYRGDIVLYVGEHRGATADGAFHDALDRDWRRVARQPVPTWYGVHDRLHVWQRRGTTALSR